MKLFFFFQKPDRFCIYYKTIISNGKLKRHMIRNHKHNEEVKEILNKSEEEQNKFVDTKRHEGIYSYNLSLMGEGKEPAMRERQPKNVDNLRCCSNAKCLSHLGHSLAMTVMPNIHSLSSQGYFRRLIPKLVKIQIFNQY